MYKKIISFAGLLLCLTLMLPVLGFVPAIAQVGAQVELSSPITDNFPHLVTLLDIHDGQGNFISGMLPENITILEDGVERPADELALLRPGVQLVVSVNPGASFAARDTQGKPTYDYIQKILKDWVTAHSLELTDDLSLLATARPDTIHLSDANFWLSALLNLGLEPRKEKPDFNILARALEVANDPTPRPGMERAVLLITALPEKETSTAIENLAAQAKQQGVHVFVWLVVASSKQSESATAIQLANLATQTDGAFVMITNNGQLLVSLEQYLEPLQYVYSLAYTSHLTQAGSHRLAVHIKTDTLDVISPDISFTLKVQPPNVAFISPPSEITRTAPSGVQAGPDTLLPKSQKLKILVEFPDGHPRPIQGTFLYVDDNPVAQNTSSPYDQFTWDLNPLITGGTHTLRVEVVDSLGLHSTTIAIPVKMIVIFPQSTVMSTVSRNQKWLAGLSVILAAAVLGFVLIVGGKLRPRALRGIRRPRRRSDPVTQPVRVKIEPSMVRSPGWIGNLHRPHHQAAPVTIAFLTPLSESQGNPVPPIPISSNEMTLGRDPASVTQVLDDPSVEGRHARLYRLEDGSFRLSDEGSIAGTWLNYTPVSREGMRLEHGDLIHIGRFDFRFTLREPGQVRKPVVIPL